MVFMAQHLLRDLLREETGDTGLAPAGEGLESMSMRMPITQEGTGESSIWGTLFNQHPFD